MTVAEFIAEQLYDLGVRYVFGVPGGPSIPYMEAFRSAGIRFILTTGEAAAGIMADVSWRITGIPGICHSTFGPGATNITTGVGCALLDRSSLLVFTSEMEDSMLNRTVQMKIDHQKLFGPVTKATFRLSSSNAAQVIRSSIEICRGPVPGPVHVGLPADIALTEIVTANGDSYQEQGAFRRNDNTGEIIRLLEKARRPLMAVGLTSCFTGIKEKVNAFLEEFRMPVVLTPMAKGIISEDHPCYAGVLFHSLSDYLEDIYSDTDLVLGVGYDPVEFNYESWLPDVPLIHFDIREMDIPEGIRSEQYIGNPDEWFTLLRKLQKGSLIFEKNRITGVRDEMESVFSGFTSHFGPVAAMKVMQDEMPWNVTLTCDVGSHLHLAGQYWKTHGKGRIIMTNGWSGMGFGIPAAIAAQLNAPESTVVCLTGDGGFLMMAGELITARRYNLPVIVVVFSDGELNLIKVKQSWKDLQPYGTILYQGDLFNADRFLGIKVLTVISAETMREALIEALAMNEPVIINAVIDPEDYKWLIVKR